MLLLDMNEISDSFAKAHIERWINAWNDRDLDTVLSMFADNIEFYSPKIKVITPEFNSEKVNNKQDLKHYWSTALGKITRLHFTPQEYYIKENTCVLEYIATFDEKRTFLSIEKFEFNEDNLIGKASAFYGSQIE
ncbi:MAG TPA: nuclear transport factor 2 family protein [Phototrophicaceae bacterium]|nr:nuclear transport factor 2 family protein [Phototrophicaceae bacterium]